MLFTNAGEVGEVTVAEVILSSPGVVSISSRGEHDRTSLGVPTTVSSGVENRGEVPVLVEVAAQNSSEMGLQVQHKDLEGILL